MCLVAVLVGAPERTLVMLPDMFGLPTWLRITDSLLGAVACLARRRFAVATGIVAAFAASTSKRLRHGAARRAVPGDLLPRGPAPYMIVGCPRSCRHHGRRIGDRGASTTAPDPALSTYLHL
jgi:hypothetical protein